MPRRQGQLIERITTPENLRLAFWKAARSKADRAEVRAFRRDLHGQLASIGGVLAAGEHAFGPYSHFRVYDPKERLIAVAPFRDRVVHHAIVNVCEPVFERACVFDTYACRLGKGAQRAVTRAQEFARRFPWFLKLDIRRYFDSIPHRPMLALLERRFKDAPLLHIFERLLDSYHAAPGHGLPIGNLTSQHLANAYLGRLDHHLKDDLGIPAYVRYMDDMVAWGDSRAELAGLLRSIEGFVEERLGLHIKDSVQLNRSARGMSFLGYRVLPGCIRLAARSRRRYVHKLTAYLAAWQRGDWSDTQAARRVEALAAFTRFADASGFRRSVLAIWESHELGHDPRARTGSNAAGAGTTPPATAPRATATTTTRTTPGTTTASGSSCPQLATSAGARTPADPDRVPFPPSGGTKTPVSPGLVGMPERAGETPLDRQPWLFEIGHPLQGDRPS